MRRVLSLFAALCLLTRGTARAADRGIALLPFENLTNATEAPARVAHGVAEALGKKGWRIVEGPAVEAALEAARVRYVDSLDSAVLPTLAEKLGTTVFVLGSIYAWEEGADPRAAFTVSLVGADGAALFSDLVSMRGEDAEKLFDAGRTFTLNEVAAAAIRRIAKSLPGPRTVAVRPATRSLPLHLSVPRTYRSWSLADGARHRVAVLPFANAGPHEAARIVAEMFARRLAASTLFAVVSPADLRTAFVAEKIHDLTDPAERLRLGKRLGTTLFLTGTIYEFREAYQAASSTPHMEMEAALTDAASGEILWTSYASRLGTDYRGLLQLGEIHGIVGLADQAVSEMIRSAEKARPTPAVRRAGAPAAATSGEKGKTR
jgi:TolB-like protein